MKVKHLVLAASLIALATSSFWVARLTTVEGKPGTVEARLAGVPTPSAAFRDMRQKIETDAAKPRFKGDLNGFHLGDAEQADASWLPSKCATDKPVEADGGEGPREEVAQSEIESSPLNFSVGYLPNNLRLVFEQAGKCSGEITSIVRNYGEKGGPLIVVMRVAAPPNLLADAPEDRLKAATIDDRPAIIQMPVFNGDRTAVYMRDGEGYWMVSGSHIDSSEVIKVAEEVR